MILCEYSRRIVQDRVHNLQEMMIRAATAIAMHIAAHGSVFHGMFKFFLWGGLLGLNEFGIGSTSHS